MPLIEQILSKDRLMLEARKNILVNIKLCILFTLKNRKFILINLFINKYDVQYFLICTIKGLGNLNIREYMSSSLDKLKALSSRLEDKLEEKENLFSQKNSAITTEPKKIKDSVQKPIKSNVEDGDIIRKENILRVKVLYEKLKIFEKSPDFDNIFIYKAMNLSGIGLKEDDFGQVREGKYIQVIAITYEPDKNGKKKAKNISLGYFGKAETLEEALKNEIIEFVLRWRYEKAFQNLEHYKDLIARVNTSNNT